VRSFLSPTETFERVNLREDEFEALVPPYVARLAAGSTWGDWKPRLDSPHGRVHPDAVIVNSEIDRWWVVEVELASHPESHFRDQFNALSDAYYGYHLVSGLARALPGLAFPDMERLLSRERPGFVCIADEASQSLTDACRDYGFQLAVMTPYRSDMGSFGLAVTRFPRDLVARRDQLLYPLSVSGEPWGGRYIAVLPKIFPNHQTIDVRYADVVHTLRITAAGTTRRIFLPLGYHPADGRVTVLASVDPARQLFELDGGR
jgi:hypothetical protein